MSSSFRRKILVTDIASTKFRQSDNILVSKRVNVDIVEIDLTLHEYMNSISNLNSVLGQRLNPLNKYRLKNCVSTANTRINKERVDLIKGGLMSQMTSWMTWKRFPNY